MKKAMWNFSNRRLWPVHWFIILMILLSVFSAPAPTAVVMSASPAAQETTLADARYIQIVAGSVHTCGLTSGGAVQCWGSNWAGQLGDGTFYSFGVPVNVNGLASGVTELASGVNSTCALLDTGVVKCWGANEFGQLGNGTTDNATEPVDVSGLSGVMQISAGGDHACAVMNDGSLRCWGRNQSGQLGNGSATDSGSPTAVVGLSNAVSSVEAGFSHTCAVLTGGEVACWGSNEFGQLGDGTNGNATSPVLLPELTGVTQLSARRDHTCALNAGGAIHCWGINWGGQLGNGTTEDSNTPVLVQGLAATATNVMAGGGFTCAIETGGRVQCWGNNDIGQLGDGSFQSSLVPVDVVGLSTGVVALGGEYSHACASSPTATVCWGANWEGELGDGVSMIFSTPREVTGLENNIVSMAAGNGITCALDSTGVVQCWGNSWAGQLGNGTWDRSSSPMPVSDLGPSVKSISAFDATICALTGSDGVKCWGLNDMGQAGDGTTQNALTPIDVVGLQSGVATVISGRNHNCALKQDETVWCWGNNAHGQLGDGTTNTSSVPVQAAGLSDVIALTAGSDHTCAVLSDRSARCWGENSDGQLGNGTNDSSLTPVPVDGLTGVQSLAASLWDTCALTTGGAVKCWGAGFAGQLGNGQEGPSNQPVDVIGLSSGVTNLTASFDHFCAVQNGGLLCWGANNGAQLGGGQTVDHSSTPAPVIGMTDHVSSVTAGSSFTCAIASGRAKCWGNNSGDQLGLGRNLKFNTPVSVLAERPRAVQLGYTSGAPGSIFTVRGSGFGAEQSVTVNFTGQGGNAAGASNNMQGTLNGVQATLTTDEFGEFIVFVDTRGAAAGSYLVQAVSGGKQATSAVTLNASAGVRLQEGGGAVMSLFKFIYLPLLKR